MLYLYLLALLPVSAGPTFITPIENKEEIVHTHQSPPQQHVTSDTSKAAATITQKTNNEPSADKKATQTINVANNIQPEMLNYQHWTGTYEPTTFILQINGEKIEPGAIVELDITDALLEVRYDYSFIHGVRTGAKIIKFQIENKADALNITFSWDNEQHVIIDKATPLAIETAKFLT